ncbi:MAG: single-stranded-DNA-specific exonuclease RecJ [Pseudomonadota bacterium]
MNHKTIKRHEANYLPTPKNLHPKLWEIFAHRQISNPEDLNYGLTELADYTKLKDIHLAARRIVEAIEQEQKILFVGDYDADGATSCALGLLALKAMGASNIDFIVPNRFEFGYGLSPEIVRVAAAQQPHLLITVDNGIASVDGVKEANALGIDVVITDHHLPAETLPDAVAIVNPNQLGDEFPSKALAGVGVIFYVMIAVRAELRARQWFARPGSTDVNMAKFLDLVALGTIADVVPLDKNNRILVENGLRRIRANACRPGIKALIDISKRNQPALAASDLGFALGPRINAAGRLDDIQIGIECLLTESWKTAESLAEILDDINTERKTIENQMKSEADKHLAQLSMEISIEDVYGIALYQPDWHQGVVGILASRIKERFHVPTIIFAEIDEERLKGSGRSIEGFHLRDALEAIYLKHPELIDVFGGHAMAAGLTIQKQHFKAFALAFNEMVSARLNQQKIHACVMSDGELDEHVMNVDFAHLLKCAGPWGQSFPEPTFDDYFNVVDRRVLQGKHLKLQVVKKKGQQVFDAILFNAPQDILNQALDKVRLAYRLDVNEFMGRRTVQLLIEYIES